MRAPAVSFALLALVCAGLACYSSREVPELTITPAELPPAQAGQPYQVTINVGENQTPVFNITVVQGELPPGMILQFQPDEGNALIKGLPSQAGLYTFNLRVSCYGTSRDGQSAERSYTLTVR
jgi:hypothetical protein